MATDLVILFVMAVAPGADHVSESGVFARSGPAAVTRITPNQHVSWEQSQGSASERITDDSSSGGTVRDGVSSRRTQRSRPASDLRLATSHAASRLATNGEAVETHVAAGSNVGQPVGEFVESSGCQCDAPRGHHHHSCWGIVGLPSPHHPPGDMTQHIPYVAHPKNYYYFRPYNYFHIADQQREVAYYGGDPAHPYANRVFERVYERTVVPFERDHATDPVTPLQPLRRR